MDAKAVNFVIMILTSGNEHERYLKVIAKFANLLKKSDIRARLLKSTEIFEIMAILESEDNN